MYYAVDLTKKLNSTNYNTLVKLFPKITYTKQQSVLRVLATNIPGTESGYLFKKFPYFFINVH